LGAAQQGVKLLCHQFALAVEFGQKWADTLKTHRLCNPIQIGIHRWQNVGLLVVQILNAVLDLAQEDIGFGQGICSGLGHQPGNGQFLQGTLCGAGAQLGELSSADHLQKLHREFNLANAAA